MAGDVPSDLVRHGFEVATRLRTWEPNDVQLQVAGLLHDTGLLIAPGDELGHPNNGAMWVGELFGKRCAELIALHVDAQRYFDFADETYQPKIAPTASFAEQAAPMTEAEARDFVAHPYSAAAMVLRRADDHTDQVDSSEAAPDFETWTAIMKALAAQSSDARSAS